MTDERRKQPRQAMQDRAVIHRQVEAPAGHLTVYCNTVDISPSGLRLKLRQPLSPGEPVILVVHVPGQRDSFHLQGVTRWCAPAQEEKAFHLGVEIDPAASPDLVAWRRLFS